MKTPTSASRPLIAVLGDASKCSDPVAARRACEALGAELARRGCRIVVFSSSRDYVEWELVKGYLSVAGTPPASIEVRYPPDLEGRFEDEVPGDPRFLRSRQTGDWEASMYPAFASFDGLLLIGGSRTTRIMGLFALGAKTSLATLGGMGGAAGDVWTHLKADRHSVATEDELNLMAEREWHHGSAPRLVEALLGQRERRLHVEREAARATTDGRRAQTLTRLAVIGCALFLAVLCAMVELSVATVPRWASWVLYGTPALAGASASAIRVIYDHWSAPRPDLEPQAIVLTIALGFWGAGVVGVLFLLPQLWVLGALDASHVFKLCGFSVPVGFVAGLTLDKVFPRLMKVEAPVDVPTQAQGEAMVRRRNSPK